MGDWKIVSSAGSVTATAPPNAPNITSVSASPYYGMQWNGSAFGAQGTINLPTGSGDYSHLKEIDISATLPDGSVVPVGTLYASFSGSTVTFKGPCNLPQTGSIQSVTLTFTCKNDDGVATPSPVTTTITVQASSVTGFSSAGETGTRHIIASNNDRLPYLTVGFVPVLNGNQVPQAVSYGISDDNGATWTPIGSKTVTSVGQQITCDRPVPGAVGTWKVYALTGAIPYDPTVKMTSLPAGAVASSGFSIAALAAPAPNNGITFNIGSFNYRQAGPEKTTIGVINPGNYTDPTSGTNTDFFLRVTIEDIDASGNPVGPEKPHAGTQITGPGNSHPYDGCLITLNGQAGERYRVYEANKQSTGPGDFANAATNTLQSVSYNGGTPADHFDVMFGAPPPGVMDPTRFDQSKMGSQFTFRNGKMDGNSPFLRDGLINGGFEDGTKGWILNSNAALDTSSPYTGVNSLKLTAGGGVQPTLQTADSYQCKPGEQFVLKAAVKAAPGTTSNGGFFLVWTDSAGTQFWQSYMGYLLVSAYSAWAEMPPLALTAPSASTPGAPSGFLGTSYFSLVFTVYPYIMSAGQWNLDQVRVEPQISTGKGTTPDGNGGVQLNTDNLSNMCMNPSFETTAAIGIPGWDVVGAIGRWGSGHSGTASLSLQGAYANCSQTFSCKPGEQYYIEAWAYHYNPGPGYDGTFTMQVEFVDSSGAATYYDTIGYASSASQGAWEKISGLTAPVPANTVKMIVYFAIVTGATNSILLVDDCIVRYQIPTGSGATPDGKGGVKSATTDLSNLVQNWRFDDGLLHWNVLAGAVTVDTVADIGTKSMALGLGSSVVIGDDIGCSPGQQLYFTARAALSSGGVLAGYWSIQGRDKTGAKIWDGPGLDLSPLVAGSGFHTLTGITVTVPANVINVYPVFSATLSGSGVWIDAVYLRLQPPTGPGMTPDGSGGVKLNTNNLSNMVLNGDFSNGLAGWSDLGLGGSENVSSGWPGGYACVLTPDVSTHNAGILETLGHACRPGDVLFASADVYTYGPCVGQSVLQMYFYDASGANISSPAYTTATATGRIKFTWTAPTGTCSVKVGVYCQAETGSGAFWIVDNVWLAPQTSTGPGMTPDKSGGVKSATTNTSNLVSNPGFEDGDVHYLKGGATTIGNYGGSAYTGNWMGVMTAVAGFTGPLGVGPANAYLMEDYPHAVRPGDQFYCEAWVSAGAGTVGQCILVLQRLDANGNCVSENHTVINGTGSAFGWTKISFNDSIPAGISSIQMYIKSQGETPGNGWYVDNLLLAKQPSTGTGTQPDTNGGVMVKPSDLNVSDFTGNLDVSRVSSLGSVNIGSFSGNLDVSRVANLGSVNISSFTGNLDVSRVANLGTLSITSFTGNLDISRVANVNTINIGSLSGVIVTSQLAAGILADLTKFATDFQPIVRVASLPTLANPAYPVGCYVVRTSDSTLWKNVANVWTAAANSEVSGKVAAGDIVSVNATTINGLITGAQIGSVNATTINGNISITNLGGITLTSLSGNLDVSRVTNLTTLSISSFTGNLDASRVANIGTISISSLGGNLDVSRVNNITNLNIGSFSGSLVIGQIGNGLITDAKITSLSIGKITGIDGATIVVNSSLTFSTPGISGNVTVNGGQLWTTHGFKCGSNVGITGTYVVGTATFKFSGGLCYSVSFSG